MRLYFNGCSFTYGDELNDPKLSSYPSLVSQQLKSEFLNDAVSGGTNQRTIYKTIQNINNYDCFVIAWTDYSRFTEYNPVDNFEINFNSQLNLDPMLHYSNDLKENYKKYLDYGTVYYKHWYNELYSFKQWLQQIILLQSLFKQHDKKYIMLNTMSNNLSSWTSLRDDFVSEVNPILTFFDYVDDDILLEEYDHIQNMISIVDHSNFLEFNKWSIVDYCQEYACGPNGHILEDGHIAVADKLIRFYNENICLD